MRIVEDVNHQSSKVKNKIFDSQNDENNSNKNPRKYIAHSLRDFLQNDETSMDSKKFRKKRSKSDPYALKKTKTDVTGTEYEKSIVKKLNKSFNSSGLKWYERSEEKIIKEEASMVKKLVKSAESAQKNVFVRSNRKSLQQWVDVSDDSSHLKNTDDQNFYENSIIISSDNYDYRDKAKEMSEKDKKRASIINTLSGTDTFNINSQNNKNNDQQQKSSSNMSNNYDNKLILKENSKSSIDHHSVTDSIKNQNRVDIHSNNAGRIRSQRNNEEVENSKSFRMSRLHNSTEPVVITSQETYENSYGFMFEQNHDIIERIKNLEEKMENNENKSIKNKNLDFKMKNSVNSVKKQESSRICCFTKMQLIVISLGLLALSAFLAIGLIVVAIKFHL